MPGVRAPAAPTEDVDVALDAIEARGKRLTHALPGLDLRLESPAPDGLVRMIVDDVLQGAHGQILGRPPFFLERHAPLRRDGALQLAEGGASADDHLGGKRLLRL